MVAQVLPLRSPRQEEEPFAESASAIESRWEAHGDRPHEGFLEDAKRNENAGIAYVVPDNLVSTRSLYPWTDLPSSPIINALQNLKEALEYIDSALQALSRDAGLEADNYIIHFQRILPELFCSRSIGDGFGMVINALMIALRKDGVTPLTESQIRAIRIAIQHLKERPKLSDSQALDLLDSLEDAGLEIDPPELDFIADLPK